MARYGNLVTLMPPIGTDGLDPTVWRRVTAHLVGVWLDDYASQDADFVEVSNDHFAYLFDTATERLIAAWGVSRGKHHEKRDKARMRMHPLSAGTLYHRGHAIPHMLGGGTDINLVPQRGNINVGPFRRLENEAVHTPGALYFTYWRYPLGTGRDGFPSQTPNAVDQGLLVPGQRPKITSHRN